VPAGPLFDPDLDLDLGKYGKTTRPPLEVF